MKRFTMLIGFLLSFFLSFGQWGNPITSFQRIRGVWPYERLKMNSDTTTSKEANLLAAVGGKLWLSNGSYYVDVTGSAGGFGVSTFNGRSGSVVLNQNDVNTALTYIPVSPSDTSSMLSGYPRLQRFLDSVFLLNQRINAVGTPPVSSVFGRTGAIVASESDYGSFFPTISRFTDTSLAIWNRVQNNYQIAQANYSTTYSMSNDIRDSLGVRYTKTQSDSRYLQSYTETDPTVYAWAKSATKPSYAVAEITGLQTALDGKQNLLGYTAENTANKGVSNGYADLDASGKIPASRIDFGQTGQTFVVTSQTEMLALSTANVGALAIRTDQNKNYRLIALPASTLGNWIALLSPDAPVQSVNGQTGNVNLLTTNIGEGTNLYYTDARARAALSAGTGISYNNTTGQISSTITQYTDALARASLSFAAGSGGYNSTTGVITIPTNTSQLTNGANFITATTNALTNYYTITQSDARFAQLTGSEFTGNLTLPNGVFYRARRSTSNAVINVLGFDSGTDNLSMMISNDLLIRNTGAVTVMSLTNGGNLSTLGTITGTAISGTTGTFSNVVTVSGASNYLSLNNIGYVRADATGNTLDLQVGSGGLRVMNAGYGAALLSMTNSGITTLNGSLHINTGASTLRIGSGLAATSTNSAQAWFGSQNWRWMGSAWTREPSTNAVMWGSDEAGGFGVWTVSSGEAATTGISGSNLRFGISNSGAASFSTSASFNSSNILLGSDGTYGGTYNALGFGGLSNGSNRIFAAANGADGIYIAAATGRAIYFRAGGGTTDHLSIQSNGVATFSSSVSAASASISGNTTVGSLLTNTIQMVNATSLGINNAAGTQLASLSHSSGVLTLNYGLNASGIANNGAAYVNFNATSSNNIFNWVSTAFASNLAAGNNLIHFIGRSGSNKNAAYLGFKYAGDGSNDNILTLGLFGVDNILNINALGLVGVATQTPSVALDVRANSGILVGANSRTIVRQTAGGDAEIGAATGGDLYLLNRGTSALFFNSVNEATLINHLTIPNGAFFRARRSTSSAIINVLGFDAGTDNLAMTISDNLLIKNTGASTIYTLTWQGAATYAAGVTATSYTESSDIRQKLVHTTLTSADGIDAIHYTFKPDGQLKWGYSAQQVQKVLPMAVHEGIDGFLKLDYTTVHTYKIAQLEKRVADLEKKASLTEWLTDKVLQLQLQVINLQFPQKSKRK